MKFLIPVAEAFTLIREHITPLESVSIPTPTGNGLTLSKDVISPIDMPPFPQSAMDGYALCGEVSLDKQYRVVAEIQAGSDASKIQLQPGEAARIFTGAMVPVNATTVAKQEIVERTGDLIQLTETCRPNLNIRPLGEQIKKGTIAAKKGTLINAGVIGYLTGLGLTKIPVYRKPIIRILVTGSELIPAGSAPLAPGQIYESNGRMLQAACASLGFPAGMQYVPDDFEATKALIQDIIDEGVDLLLVSGGISVGDYDFTGKALNELKTEEIFYKVQQKPGKPLFFGKNKSTVVFGLPGNPASALSCFNMYVTKALEQLTGRKSAIIRAEKKKLAHDYLKKGSFINFLKGHVDGDKVYILNAQSSAMLSAYTDLNCLIELPAERNEFKADEEVDIHFI